MIAPDREELDARLRRTSHLGRELRGICSAEDYARRSEDLIELLGSRCFSIYCALGGQILSVGAWRARVREMLFPPEEQAA